MQAGTARALGRLRKESEDLVNNYKDTLELHILDDT